MTDVRLTATTTDGEVVPVLSNTKGELLLEAPIAPPPFDGNLDGELTASGAGTFGNYVISVGDPTNGVTNGTRLGSTVQCCAPVGGPVWNGFEVGTSAPTSVIQSSGAATFSQEVVIGSRGSKWLIRESNGVAMLIEQTKRGAKEPRIEEEVEVRDLPRELDLVEAALSEIMGKLKMTPPAGWPVWDGDE